MWEEEDVLLAALAIVRRSENVNRVDTYPDCTKALTICHSG
jgi:hypothetical protein